MAGWGLQISHSLWVGWVGTLPHPAHSLAANAAVVARSGPQVVRDGPEHAVAVARHDVHFQPQLCQPLLQPRLLQRRQD